MQNNQPLLNEAIKKLAGSGYSDLLLGAVEELQNKIADVRVGDYSAESRKVAIDILQTELYNKIKGLKKSKSSNNPDSWM